MQYLFCEAFLYKEACVSNALSVLENEPVCPSAFVTILFVMESAVPAVDICQHLFFFSIEGAWQY